MVSRQLCFSVSRGPIRVTDGGPISSSVLQFSEHLENFTEQFGPWSIDISSNEFIIAAPLYCKFHGASCGHLANADSIAAAPFPQSTFRFPPPHLPSPFTPSMPMSNRPFRWHLSGIQTRRPRSRGPDGGSFARAPNRATRSRTSSPSRGRTRRKTSCSTERRTARTRSGSGRRSRGCVSVLSSRGSPLSLARN